MIVTKDQEERLIAAINLNTWMTSRQILLEFYTTNLHDLLEHNVRNAVNLVNDVNRVIGQIEIIYKPTEDDK